MGEIVVAITGASGAIYGKRLLEVLNSHGRDTRLVVSNAGEITLQHECGMSKETLAEMTNSVLDDEKNIGGKSASGSAKIDHYVVCPASGTTISKIAAGISDNLVTRSALVALKERRPLIVIPRESPYATVHLENMTKLSNWGVVVLPASPGFYHNPQNIDDLVDFVVARILDQMGIEHSLGKRWTGEEVQ